MSASVSSRQGSASAGAAPGQASADDAAREQAAALFQQMIGTSADPVTLAAEQQALAGGASPQDLRGLVAHSDAAKAAINGFYRDVLGVDADAQALANVEAALGAGQSLAEAEAFLRPQFAHSATAQASIQALYQGVAGRAAGAGELATSEDALAHGQSLDQMRSVLLNSDTASAPAKQVNALYQQVLGRDADLGGLAANEAALAGGATPDQLRSGLAHSDEAGRDINVFYGEVRGRPAEAAGVAHWQDQLGGGEAVGDVRSDIARSPEALAQVQADFARQLGRPASASEVEGYQAAKWTAAPGAVFTVSSNAGVLGTGDARTVVAELGAFVTLSGGQTPTLTGPDGQVTYLRNATELAGFVLGQAERSGQATPALLKTYDLTVSWLGQVGQADIQAATKLQAMAQADGAAGNAQGAYLESVGAQLAMQIQAMPPGQRHALTQRVPLGGQVAADVTVSGDAGDRRSLAGFSYAIVDTDPDRTRLIAAAQAQVAAAAQDAGNPLLAALDQAQARVDVAYAGLPAGARTDKMLGVAQQFVDAGRGAAAAGNWNLVQTLETAADVSLQIAAQPEGSRTKLTERFMHKDVKHDITVDPNAADPFASFQDHSKGQDAVGAIVQGVVGVVINLATLIPGSQGFTVPLAVAWDAGQAGRNFADGNVLGGVLNLGAAAGVGLVGLGAASQAGVGAAPGSFAANAGQMANSIAGTLGFTDTAATATTAAVSTAQAAGHVGAEVLEGTALLGGLSGAAQSAAQGDPLGIAAGVLEAASAVAGGLVTTDQLTNDAAREFARRVSAGAGLASVGASSADAFAHGDLAGGLLASLNALLTQVAHEALDPPATAKPPGAAGGGTTPPATTPGGPGVDELPTTAPAGGAGGSGTSPFDGPGTGGATDPANPNPILSDSDGPTRTLPDGTSIAPAGYAVAGKAGMVEVAASALEALAATSAGRAALAAAEVVLGPEVAAAVAVGGTVYLSVKAVQVLLDYNVLPSGPASQTNVAGYDGTVLGRQSLGVEVNPQAGTGVLYNALGPGGGPLAGGQGAPLSYDAATGTLTGADGTVVGRYAEGRMTPALGVDLPALVRGSPLIIAPPSVLGNGVLADPIPPPVPTGPPQVPPQVDNPPEAFVPLPVPGQAGDEGLTIPPPVPSNLPGMPIDGPQLPTIFAASSFGNMDLPRTPGLGSSASMGELVAQDAVPAKDGVVITDPVKDPSELFPDMYRLSQATGAEYALVRRPDGALVLYSGAPNVVRSPMEYEPIAHTHPDSSEPLPSLQDIQVLNDVWMENPTLPRPNSTIVWGSGPNESTPYHATGLDDLSSPK